MNNLTTLYIVRHGESEANVKLRNGEIIETGDYSALGSPLTENGKAQAAKLAEKLKDIRFDAAFSSDFLRAKETAEIMTIERDLALQTTQAIRERRVGSDEGKWHRNYKKMQEELSKLAYDEKMNFRFEDGETRQEALTRLMTFTREVAVAHQGKTVLIVCHGNIMRSFLIKLGFATDDELPSGSLENTAYFILQSDGVDFFLKEVYGAHKVTN